MECEPEGFHLPVQFLGIIFFRLGELVQVSETLLIFVHAETQIPGLESRIAEVLQFRRNLVRQRRGKLLALMVLREVLVGIASGVRNLLIGIVVLLTRQLAAVCDRHVGGGFVGLGGHILDPANDALSIDHLAEDDVLSVEVGGFYGGDEELAAVCTGAGVGHGEEEGPVVFQVEVFVGELFAVDRFAAGSVECSEISSLDHELFDYAVED